MSIILITGSSTGIGYATAETLARNGHTVYATMRNPKRSPKLQEVADKDLLPINVLPLDVLDDQSVHNTINQVIAKEGFIDVLINNAGIHSWGAIEELPLKTFRDQMDTNYLGIIRCIKGVLPAMRERKRGLIINVSSVAGRVFSNFHGSYAPTKAAMEAVSEALAQELKPYDVRVAVVEPAFIETPIFNKANEIPSDTHYPHIKRFLSMFAATLENHESPQKVADVINEIVSGKRTEFRNTVGLYADGFLSFRGSMSDDDWINSVTVSDEDWTNGMEEMGLKVTKYMKEKGLPEVKV